MYATYSPPQANSHLAIAKVPNKLRTSPYAGVRIGEASHPGPPQPTEQFFIGEYEDRLEGDLAFPRDTLACSDAYNYIDIPPPPPEGN